MNNKKRTFAACTLLIALWGFSMGSQAKEWKAIRIATEGVYEPWNKTLADGRFDGFEPEMANILCTRIKLQCTVIAQDWDGLIPGLQAGKFDVVMDALAISEARKNIIGFSRPYTKSPASFIAPASSTLKLGDGSLRLSGNAAQDNPGVQVLRAGLKGKTIGIVAGTVYGRFIHEQFDDIATVREYKSPTEPIMDLRSGRVDVVFDDHGYLTGVLGQSEGGGLALVGPRINGPIWGEGEAFGIRKGDTELKAMLDEGIASMIEDGTINRLSQKWFKHDFTPEQ